MALPIKKLWSRSLRVRLVSYFSLLSLLTVTAMGVLTFLGARVLITRLVFDRLRVTVLLKEDALNLWINNQKDATFALAQLPEIRNHTSILINRSPNSQEYQEVYLTIKNAFISAIASRPEMAQVFILEKAKGRVIVSTNSSNEGQEQTQDTYFTEGQKKTFIQNVYPSPKTGQPTMTIATPIRDTQSRVIAVLGVHLNLKQMDRIVLERVGLGSSGKTYLVDRHNTFVSGNRLGLEKFPNGIYSEGINNAIKGNNSGGLYNNYAGIPVIGYYRWLEDFNLALLVEIDRSEAYRPARLLAWGILGIGFVAGFLLTCGVYLLAQQITRPILAIKDTAIRVAAGDLSQVAPVMTQDEVGVLAKAFNKMTERLRELYEGLEEKVQQLELAELSVRQSLQELEIEQARSERLLTNTFPKAIARRLKLGEQTIAENFEHVSVLFADLVSFTQLSECLSPRELVSMLNQIFSKFDHLSEKYDLEKIKTIGDAYMVVGGLPKPKANHAEAIAAMALEMLVALADFNRERGENHQIRIGIHSGSVVAGAIGIKKFTYDLWGDTVNVASRMESQGLPGKIQVTSKTYHLLKEQFIFEERGLVDVKGKGQMMTYFLIGQKENSASNNEPSNEVHSQEES